MDQRSKDIINSVDNLLRVHDEWEADDSAPIQPTEAFEQAITEAISVSENGDVPSQCRELCESMSRLSIEWDAYSSGVKRTPDYRPVGSFWGAFRNVIHCRAGATPITPNQPEPMFLLMEQKVTYSQIAFHIWGHQGKGPFVTDSGQPDIVKIHEEAKEPGKHTAGWVHPEQQAAFSERQQQLSRRLSSVSNRENSDSPQHDPATIESLLREGQYPDVIAKVKGVTLSDVLSVASRAGIKPSERPNFASMRAPHEPMIPGGETDPSSSSHEDESESDGDEPTENIDDQIRELNDGTRGKAEIVAEMKSRGIEVTFRDVEKVIKPKRSKQTATA